MSDVSTQETGAVSPETEQAVAEGKPLPGTEKFWDEDKGGYNQPELAKAYQNLQQKLGKGSDEEDTSTEETDKTSQDQDQDEAASKVVENAGLDVEELQKQYDETGEIPAESREKIAEALKPLGLGPEAIDTYLKAKQAEVDARDGTLKDIAGGEEQWQAVSNWAAKELTPDEIKAYNEAVNHPNIDVAKLAVQGLVARFSRTNTLTATNKVSGNRPTGSGIKPYTNRHEIIKMVNSAEYKNDPTVRANHEKRLAITKGL